MIVADTGAMVDLVDRKDRHHRAVRKAYEAHDSHWVLPWAILPEVDYLLGAHVGIAAQAAFLEDVSDGGFAVYWGGDDDLDDALGITRQHAALRLGLVDAVVIAVAGTPSGEGDRDARRASFWRAGDRGESTAVAEGLPGLSPAVVAG
jgi:uncharacterized protein